MEKLLLKVSEVVEVTGLGRSKIYELVATGQLETCHVGRAVRFPAEAVRQFVDRLREGERT